MAIIGIMLEKVGRLVGVKASYLLMHSRMRPATYVKHKLNHFVLECNNYASQLHPDGIIISYVSQSICIGTAKNHGQASEKRGAAKSLMSF